MTSNAETVRELIDVMTNDSENLDRFLPLLADECVWVLYPGGSRYSGISEIRTFIAVALELRGRSKPRGEGSATKVTVQAAFGNTEQLCIEYAHAFSFGDRIPLLGKTAGATDVHHCNTYSLRDGKIIAVHEYASSPLWWLNLAMQMVLGRIHKQTVKRLQAVVR